MADYTELMLQFRRGWARADRSLVGEAISPDFEWHTHTFPGDAPVSTGRVLHGIDGVFAEISRRADAWSDVHYDGLVERYTEGFVTQTFTISGVDSGRPFKVAAVDLYTIVDGRIAKKDTYWKQPDRGARQ